jgi:K(+)-stimulated pyrophosphate-energized sodium pump
LAGSIFSGLIFALLMSNAGGLWDNAKKYIEAGAFGGKGSEPHKAAVVGDTVGDPFKDTAGPSLNTLITVMSLVASVFAQTIVLYALL